MKWFYQEQLIICVIM